ncbi:MAG: hypothetical protein ACJ708_00195 [Nitrososphaeraceae archaeon]
MDEMIMIGEPPYDKEKYREMTLDDAETVLGFLALIGPLTAISVKRIREEESGMKN